MVALSFNASSVKPNAAFEAVPSGNYPVIITNSQKKPTQKGDGAYYEFEMTIQGGEYAGRKLFDRLNIENPNKTAEEIAYATLSAICHVTGRLSMTDTQQLHGIPFIAVAVKKPRNDQPEVMTNEVRGYKDINGNDPGKAPGAGGAPQGQGGPTWGNPQGGPTNMQQGQPQQQGNWQQPQQQQPQNQQWGAPQGQPQQQQPNGWGNQQPQSQQPQQQQPQGNGQPQLDPNAPPPWAAAS